MDLNGESTCDLENVPASSYDIKTAIRLFDTINDIVRSYALAQSLLKGQNASIRRKQESTHVIILGTDGLSLAYLGDSAFFANSPIEFATCMSTGRRRVGKKE